MKIYSYASVWEDNLQIALSHGHTEAGSEDEARGIALRRGQESFPKLYMLFLEVLEIECPTPTPTGA